VGLVCDVATHAVQKYYKLTDLHEAIEVGPGEALCIPRGAVHRFDNLGSEDVKQLAVVTPAIVGPAYFRGAAQVIGAAAGGPPARAKMMELFRRHGMTVAAPPPAK
jgi:hypothetical protein